MIYSFQRVDESIYSRFKNEKVRLLMTNDNISIINQMNTPGVNEDFDGSQFTVMADLYRYRSSLIPHIRQVIIRASLNADTLVDTVGREGKIFISCVR